MGLTVIYNNIGTYNIMLCKCGTEHTTGVCNYKQDPEVRRKKLEYKAEYRSTRRIELANKEKKRMKDPKTHQRKLEWDRAYKKRPEYRDKFNAYQKEWHKTHPDYKKQEYLRNIKTYQKYKQENPQSGHIGYPELYESMMNVRFRDNNTCQWAKCGRKHLRGKIAVHVHHIFPRSEYPDLELVEQYMICYCKEHHIKWHEVRGDINAVNILNSKRTLV